MYFTHKKLSDSLIRITDITKTAIYLVIGTTKACLIDTGCGFGNLKEYVEQLTDLPYDIILTHGHVDHASGAGYFTSKNIYLHPDDRSLMNQHTCFEMRKKYAEHTHAIDSIDMADCAPLYDSGHTLPLSDGQIFSLGNLTLQIIHAPGHTIGMCMVLIPEERTILFGDGCGVNVMLLEEAATSVETYLHTLTSLTKYEPLYDTVYRNHGTCESHKEILHNVIQCCEDVLHHKDDHIRVTGLVYDYEDAYLARERDANTRKRKDGKEGNLIYRECTIYN